MHLFRTKAIVKACEEHMFEEYRIERLEDRPEVPDHLIREDFDELLDFWQR